MRKIIGLLAFLLVAGIGAKALAQEKAWTQEELAKLPMYERLLEGDNGQKATTLEKSYDKALEAEDWAEARKLAQELLELRIDRQGPDHYDVTGARQLLQMVDFQSKLTSSERKRLIEADQQNQQMLQLQQIGQLHKAAEIGERSLATKKKLLGENHPDFALSLRNLAALYRSLAEYGPAEQLHVQVRDLRKKLLGDNHPDYAQSLNDLGGLYRDMGKYGQAEPLLLQAHDLRKKLLGETHPNYAATLNELAVLYLSKGDYAKAEPLLVTANDLFKKQLGENHPNFANSLNNLAYLYHVIGKYEQAEQVYLQTRDQTERVLGKNHPSYALCLNNLADLYRLMGEYSKAESLLLQAHALHEKLLGANHPNYVLSLTGLGIMYHEMGKFAQAEPFLLEALNLQKRIVGERHPNFATSLRNLAMLYQALGEYGKAEPLLFQARDLYKNLLGENHPDYAASLDNLATLYQALGEYAKAEPLFIRALYLRKELLGENHPNFAISLNSLALLYESLGDYTKAEPLMTQGCEVYKMLLGENHPDYFRSLSNLAALHARMGEYAKAEPLLIQSNDLFKKVLGENHPDYATSLSKLAMLYESMGEYTKAEPLMLQARDLNKKLLGEKHPDYASSLKNLAGLYCLMRQYAKAEPLLTECSRSFEMSRIARASGFQRATGGEGGNPYFYLGIVSVRLNNPQQGLVALERNLARAFLDVQAQRLGRTLTADQQARQSRILDSLSPIEKRIATLVVRVNLTEEETAELTEKIAARSLWNVELADLAAELSTQEVSDFAAIQQAIPLGHALLTWAGVSYKSGVEEHFACILRSSGDPFWVPLTGSGENGQWTKEDSQLPGQLRDALAHPVPASNLPDLVEQLRRQRIEPVLAHLKEQGITQLYVVGVDQMAGLPVEVIAPEFTVSYVSSGTFLARLPEKPKFENTLFAVGDPIYEVEKAKQLELTALPTHGLLVDALAPGGKAEELGLSSGQVLLQYGDANLTSIDDLKAAVQKATDAGLKTTNVTVWSVDDSNQPGEQVVEFPVGPLGVILSPDPAPAALVSRRKSEAVFASISRGEEWSDLPGTRYEVEQLRKLFPASTALLDDQANEAAVDAFRQADDLSKFRYLHFATHGKGNSVTAFESKLVLSQDQPKEEIKAGQPWMNNEISAREVLDYWKLNADLVTLSACQTGLGRQGGGEGLLGFAQAFLLSGSRSVCLSLWEVDDIATALLMQRFYQNLLGQREGLTAPMPKAKALADAKDWLRNLTAAEATALTAQLTGGIARGTRQEKTFKVPPPSTPAEIAAGDDYKPYARPHYWAAFILIGDPE